MRIIRGATTIEKDDPRSIQHGTKELLDELFSKNRLETNVVRGIVFSLTSDIHSFSPAKSARIAGYDTIPLFSTLEPDIRGGLPLCIRVMVFTDLQGENDPIKHIYLKGATILRKDIAEPLNIALDGPAGSGKSTIAKALAKDYNILYLDTGAMYRACALVALRMGIDPKNREQVEAIADDFNIRVEYKEGAQHTFLGEEDVSETIRQNEVSLVASSISAHPIVREKMVEMQRKIAKSMSCVLDGRDIGSTVLPNANFKFFVTADSKVRANRRYLELLARGQEADLEKIHEEIILRDKQDTEREFSPLKMADDAVLVDTSAMSIEEVVATIKTHIQEKI